MWSSPRVYFLSYFFRSINPKIPCCTFYLLILFCVSFRSIYPISYNLIYLSTEEGLTTPLKRWVASFCYLCEGTVCIVWWILLLDLYLGFKTKGNTSVDVLHHTFLFGEIPTRLQTNSHRVIALIGDCPPVKGNITSGVPLKWLQENWSICLEGADEKTVGQYTRAYLWYLLKEVVFPDCSWDSTLWMYLGFLED